MDHDAAWPVLAQTSCASKAPDLCEDRLATLARETFKVEYLFPLQRLVMANIVDACLPAAPGAQEIAEAGGPEDAVPGDGPLRQAAILPTGFGKSLCFQLPALVLPGPTLVIYPLLALMEDQVRRLGDLGLPCAVFRGGQSPDERKQAEKSVESCKAKIIITNPESLRGRLLDFLAANRPSHVSGSAIFSQG